MSSYYKLILLFFFLLTVSSSYGSHIRAGEITISQSDCNKSKFSVTLTIYGDTGSPVSPGGGVLSFGDGFSIVVGDGDFTPRPDLAPKVGIFIFHAGHLYTTQGNFKISYSEPNRNGGILNIQNSIDVPFFIESMISVKADFCNSSPQLLAAPIDRACSMLAFYHNPGAFDSDGDSLSYVLTMPKAPSNQVAAYLPPNNVSFYGTNFNAGNEAMSGPPDFTIDPISGTISWDAPKSLGEYNIAFVVEEWRKINDVFVKIGSVTRDMQIIVEECINKRPDFNAPVDMCVIAGTAIITEIVGIDPDGDPIKLEVFSGIFSLVNNPAVLNPSPAVFKPSGSPTSFSWTPSCSEVRNQPYQVTFKISDNPSAGPPLVRFRTWNIKVIAPPPVVTQVELDIVNKTNRITWMPYPCLDDYKIIVWRKVGSYQFTVGECFAGMPKYAGYERIVELPSNVNEFVDTNNEKGLDVGAVFCYRLTAERHAIGGAESKVSSEVCAPPILADAPVITHVSVLEAGSTDGKIIVSWRSPFDLSNPEYLKPYQYSLVRAKGLTGDSELTVIQSGAIQDTTFTDVGLNTKSFAYNYRIVLFAKRLTNPNPIAIDTSAVASSVWNAFVPLKNSIELNWQADTPWSNVDPSNPWHLIYRRSESSLVEDFELIDSVNVIENGFNYLDEGKFNSTPLSEYEYYYYRTKTRGTYGNPAIHSPQENFSQTVAATIFDNTPPCAPTIVQTNNDCDSFNLTTPCNQVEYENEIAWLDQSGVCEPDTYSFNIYAAASSETEYTLIGSVSDLNFYDKNLIRKARCYRVAAVDRAGNVSDFSDPICFDNCPSINFPNVFTPDGDAFNPYFTTYNSDDICTRFVNNVSLTIFDRWGQRVIDIKDTGAVQWDGTDGSGNEVATGIYFFSAEVFFDVNDPNKKFDRIKGWVQVVR